MALKGIKVVELAGLAPAPFCGMILSDFGASVIRVDRARAPNADRLGRGKASIAVDLKQVEGCGVVKKLCMSADVLIEPFRPGVMEKLGLGPKDLMAENKGLVYARLTGYGQNGPLRDRAGHDINYLAISGLLSRLGRKDEKPYAPINLLADFAGGGMVCALGIVLALFDRTRSGRGQVIDANMVEGAAYIGSFVYHMLESPIFTAERGQGWLDGGAPFYDTYKTKDGKYVSVGAIEAQFYKNLLNGLGVSEEDGAQFHDWDALRRRFTAIFASQTQAHWRQVFDGVDACVAPVLSVSEAAQLGAGRGTFEHVQGIGPVPIPAPRLSETPGETSNQSPDVGENSMDVLREAGYSEEECARLMKDGIVEGPASRL